MVDLMKIEDPFSPPGDQPDLNKLRRTKQATPVLGRNLFGVFPQPGLLRCGRGRRTLVLAAIWTHPVIPPQCLLYWCCRLDERGLEPGLEGSELPLGAWRACGSSC